ncbi:MAG TPA: response regulator [Humisphaera sp.]
MSPARATAAAPAVGPAGGARSLLLVEDDGSSAHALSLILRRYGWSVDVVATVADALAYLDAHTPSAVILDLMLPDGSGADVLARVRQRMPGVPVTVTTASTDPERLAVVRSLQPKAVVRKPIDLAELLRTLQ